MKLRYSRARFHRFRREVVSRTPIIALTLLLVLAWLGFSAGIYLAEAGAPGSRINDFGEALYWCVAAFTTAGLGGTPVTDLGQVLGGVWMIAGSALFFGAIVATITAWFMRPMQRPASKIIDTIEYNLERLDDLTVEELELLKRTTDGLILHMEKLRKARERGARARQSADESHAKPVAKKAAK